MYREARIRIYFDRYLWKVKIKIIRYEYILCILYII